MKSTEFFKPETLKEAVDLLNKYKEESLIVNGGTDIVEKIAKDEVDPGAIIYISDIEELRKIEEKEDSVVIGGSVTYREVLESPFCQKFPGLIQAVKVIGSPPIREVGTPAGNIATSAPAPDCNVMLIALEAELVLASVEGERRVKVEDFFRGTYKNVMKPNEIIKEIKIPLPKENAKSGYLRLARRKGQDIAKVLIGVSMVSEGEVCKEIKIGLGALNASPVRVYSVEKALTSNNIEETLKEIRNVFPEEANPRESRFKEWKETVLNSAIERAIMLTHETV
ncbi:MAG: FAD binding domain-containing protein [Bacillota bacterium]|nr:FAD binding domain-containing protein [Bacillota bacterium]